MTIGNVSPPRTVEVAASLAFVRSTSHSLPRAALARLEGRIAVRELLTGFPEKVAHADDVPLLVSCRQG